MVTVGDLQSRNGVYVNGHRCSRAPLKLHDVVRCGEWIGIVETSTFGAGFREITPGWFGGSRLYAAIEPATRISSDVPVVIQGETGSGKEGVAQAIHRWSARVGPLVAVNCATLPEHLAESELFGHKKGAFSGADRASPGLFLAADGGTLFLDEILELSLSLQAKLLRAIERREVLPLGETKPVCVDIRIIAAAQEPLADAVADGRFRADLHARLDGLTVTLPPLRERPTDIIPLFLEFASRGAKGRPVELDAKFVEALCVYDWPLNIRELSMLARRLMDIQGNDSPLKRNCLPDRILRYVRDEAKDSAPSPAKRIWQSAKDDQQYETLLAALRENNGSVAKAAAIIGITRARAYRLIAAHPKDSSDSSRD